MPPHKKLTMRKQNALITKQTIYDAARELFISKGYENVKIEDITTAANVAKGTFYIYFGSKKDLLYYTFDDLDIIYMEIYGKINDRQTFKSQLIDFLTLCYQSLNTMGRELAKALYYNSILEKNPKLLSNERSLFQIIRKIVDVGIKTGELNSQHSEDYYVSLIKIQIIGIDYFWIVSPEIEDFSSFAKLHINTLVHGILNAN